MTETETEPGGPGDQNQDDTPEGAGRALLLATLALAVSFLAWGLISPLAPDYRDELGLTSVQTSALVATPVLLGALLRIPLGALTDRHGGRKMFTICCFGLLAPLAVLAMAESYPLLMLGAFLLGLGGAAFAIGVPFVNGWFPAQRRGFALGVYGAGNIGTGLAAFFAPRISSALSRPALYGIVAVIVAVVGLGVLLFARDAPGRQVPTESMVRRFAKTVRMRVAQDLSALYAITFGAFVAFGAYLPTYLKEVFELETADAAARAGGFILLATLGRPVGGWLSDRFGGARVLTVALLVVGSGAIVIGFEPGMAISTICFLTVAAALGNGNGAVFALLSSHTPAERVGSVTGLVGAAGGLGGFIPPLIMGVVYQSTDHYGIGLWLLAATALAGMGYTWWRFISPEQQKGPTADLATP